MDKILLRNIGRVESSSINVYREHGGYNALKTALNMPPDEITNMVRQADLRGRGGAGFPANLKWKFIPRNSRGSVYLICNADEGEPGTFKDRQIMEFDPHLLLEGMAIAAFAIGAAKGTIYIRGEYFWISNILQHAIEEATQKGFLGKHIMGTDFSFSVELFRGAGSYVCGEETALMESIEGKPGRPRLRPPFPAVSGLYRKPTVVHNVTTLSCLPYIIEHGPDRFRFIGKLKRGGTKLFGISGHVNRPGMYEYPMGTNLRELIYEAAGGVRGGKQLKAVIPGGISTPIIRADETDVAMDFDPLKEVGTMLGSGGIIVMDEDTSIPLVAQKAVKFFAHESCGQCAPCREGTHMMKFLIDRLVQGEGQQGDLEHILRLCSFIKGATICAFGYAATQPIAAMIKKFRDEFEALL